MSGVTYPSRTPVRTPDPLFSSKRRALERLGSFKAMGLGAIGDIASTSFTTVDTLTWNTASDWDSAVDESGVVHENTANSDHTDAALVKQGYPLGDPILSTDLVDLWALHEDSGSTVNSFVSGGRDGTYNGPTLGQTGLQGTTAPSFDGADDYITVGPASGANVAGSSAMSFAAWHYSNGPTGPRDRVYNIRETNQTDCIVAVEDNQDIRYRIGDDNDNYEELLGDNFLTGTWNLMTFTWTASTSLTGYLNGNDISANMTRTDQSPSAVLTGDDNEYIGARNDSGGFTNGKVAYVMTWTRELSASEVQTLYDVVGSDGFLLGATKSFSNASTPDLQNLDYSLNGHSIDLDVIGSPGAAGEEIVTQTLDGATSYTLSWTNSHTDFRIKPVFSSADATVTPTFNRGELVN
jgi:hypothetical protein